ncbi:transglycosylase SLT domain-containing protein [candidate division GN15 bacterium]|nr:transglycosylase SLT domain-containing protein [candidate division GN15 bacterium]
MSGSMGKDTFTQMFDMEIGRRVARGGPGSISGMLYKSLEKVVDARYKAADSAGDPGGTNSLQENGIPIDRDGDSPGMPVRRPIDIPDNSSYVPIRNRVRSGSDPITSRFGEIIDRAAAEHKLDSALIRSVIRAESNGDPQAVSHAGAKGLMQLMDSTAADLGVTDSFDPAQNIAGGTRYLAALLNRFGDLRLALAAYNAGPGAVEKHGGVPPYAETENYVEKVTRLFQATRTLTEANDR